MGLRLLGRASAWPSTARTPLAALAREVREQRLGRSGSPCQLGDVLGRAGTRRRRRRPAPPSGPELDQPVRALEHFEVVLDHEHAVAALDEVLQRVQQAACARPRSAARSSARRGCRTCVPVDRPRELARELDALRLAARQRRARLAERQVAETRPPRARRPRMRSIFGCAAEEAVRVRDRHLEDLVDACAP